MTTPYDTIKSAILGNPIDPNKQPSRQGVVKAFAEMQAQVEGIQSGAIVKSTFEELAALTSVPYSGVMAWVTNDGMLSGIYENVGTANAPSFQRRTALPQFVVSGINVGDGTENAIKITTDLSLPVEDGRTMIVFPLVATNTGDMSVSINDGPALPILTNSGNQLNPGAGVNGMNLAGFLSDNGTTIRLISDTVSNADRVAAELAATTAEDAAVIAINAMSSAALNIWTDKATAELHAPSVAPAFMMLAGWNNPNEKFDNGVIRFDNVGGSEPTHAFKFSITTDPGGVVTWFEGRAQEPNLRWFGAPLDGSGDDAPALASAINYVGSNGVLVIPPNTVRLNTDVDAGSVHIIDQGATWIGNGIIKSRYRELRLSSGIHLSRMYGNIAVRGTLRNKSLSTIAEVNAGNRFPDKYIPRMADFEFLRLSPGVNTFERTSNGDQDCMTAQYVREVIRLMNGNKIQTVRIPYGEYQAFNFHRSNMPEWPNFDSGKINWGTKPTNSQITSISPLSGAACAVTVTANAFPLSSMVGRWIYAGSGRGKVVSQLSATQVTVDTTATGGAAFSASSWGFGDWGFTADNNPPPYVVLAATSGTNFQVTSSTPLFVSGDVTSGGDVGRWIYTDAGRAIITFYVSPTVCTASTVAPRTAPFADAALLPGSFNIARPVRFWKEWLTGYPNVETFDPLHVILDECDKLGMSVIVGLTRGGDEQLMNDLFATRQILPTPSLNATLSATNGTFGSPLTFTVVGGTPFSTADIGKDIVFGNGFSGRGRVVGFSSSTVVTVATDRPLGATFSSVNISAGNWYFSGPDPKRLNMTTDQRLTENVNINREYAADLFNKFGRFASFGGFYHAHEPDHIGAAKLYFNAANWVPVAHPAIRSYGLPIVMAPSSPSDLGDNNTFANDLISCGCDLIAPQDSIGPGLNYDPADTLGFGFYTYCPKKTLKDVGEQFRLWRVAVDRANGRSLSGTFSMRLLAGIETWKMGLTFISSITLDKLSGYNITVTPNFATFTVTWINGNYWLSSEDGGFAFIRAWDNVAVPPKLKVDTVDANGNVIGRAFSSLTYAADKWARTSGYRNDYPTSFATLQLPSPSATDKAAFTEIFPYVDAVCLYAWFGLVDPGTLSLRLTEMQPGASTHGSITNFRTKAAELYSGLSGWISGQITKYENAKHTVSLLDKFLDLAVMPAPGTSVTGNLGFVAPQDDQSEMHINMTFQGTKVAGASNIVGSIRLNGVNVKSFAFAMDATETGINFTIPFRFLHKGMGQTVECLITSSAGNITATRMSAEIREIKQ